MFSCWGDSFKYTNAVSNKDKVKTGDNTVVIFFPPLVVGGILA